MSINDIHNENSLINVMENEKKQHSHKSSLHALLNRMYINN